MIAGLVEMNSDNSTCLFLAFAQNKCALPGGHKGIRTRKAPVAYERLATDEVPVEEQVSDAWVVLYRS